MVERLGLWRLLKRTQSNCRRPSSRGFAIGPARWRQSPLLRSPTSQPAIRRGDGGLGGEVLALRADLWPRNRLAGLLMGTHSARLAAHSYDRRVNLSAGMIA